MEQPSNQSLKIMVDNLDRRTEERHREMSIVLMEIRSDVKEIKTQTVGLYQRVDKLEWWRSGIVWLVGFLITLVGLSFPVLRAIVKSEIEKTVRESVIAVLAEFELKVEE